MNLNNVIPFVFEVLMYMVLTLLVFVFLLGTEGRDGVLGRIIDGNTIMLEQNVNRVTDLNEVTIPRTSGLSAVATTTF